VDVENVLGFSFSGNFFNLDVFWVMTEMDEEEFE
jgi:hypothetical protein